MLTPTDKRNIQKFETLKPNHQRVFKHRLRHKCITAIKDIEYVLTYCNELQIRPDKFVDINSLISLMKTYEDTCLLQNT